MWSRGPWNTCRAEGIVSGFYKFTPPGARLDERSYREMCEIDPGLPAWAEFLVLLADSPFRVWVHT